MRIRSSCGAGVGLEVVARREGEWERMGDLIHTFKAPEGVHGHGQGEVGGVAPFGGHHGVDLGVRGAGRDLAVGQSGGEVLSGKHHYNVSSLKSDPSSDIDRSAPTSVRPPAH